MGYQKTIMKFLIISVFDDGCHHGPSFREISKISSRSIIDYCNTHGYDYKIESQDLDKDRHISWSKLYLARKYLKDYDWVWCIDSDAMIMNHTIRLENVVDNNYDIIVALRENRVDSINTGSILYRNTDWNRDFMGEMYKQEEFKHSMFLEQSALQKLFLLDSENLAKKHIKLVNHRLFNSYYHGWYPNENFRPEDFVIHLAGTSNDYRLKMFEFLRNYIIKVPDYKIPFKQFINIGD